MESEKTHPCYWRKKAECGWVGNIILMLPEAAHCCAKGSEPESRYLASRWLSHGKDLTLVSLCVPFPRMRISVQYSSRDILALRLRDSLRGSCYHPFSHYPYNPEGVKDFNLMFSEGTLPYRDSKCVASNHKANRALDSRSVLQNGSEYVQFVLI